VSFPTSATSARHVATSSVFYTGFLFKDPPRGIDRFQAIFYYDVLFTCMGNRHVATHSPWVPRTHDPIHGFQVIWLVGIWGPRLSGHIARLWNRGLWLACPVTQCFFLFCWRNFALWRQEKNPVRIEIKTSKFAIFWGKKFQMSPYLDNEFLLVARTSLEFIF
jgi:hypothetical protein